MFPMPSSIALTIPVQNIKHIFTFSLYHKQKYLIAHFQTMYLGYLRILGVILSFRRHRLVYLSNVLELVEDHGQPDTLGK